MTKKKDSKGVPSPEPRDAPEGKLYLLLEATVGGKKPGDLVVLGEETGAILVERDRAILVDRPEPFTELEVQQIERVLPGSELTSPALAEAEDESDDV
jgi:hypothetical protein